MRNLAQATRQARRTHVAAGVSAAGCSVSGAILQAFYA